jgi:hypothetical protein
MKTFAFTRVLTGIATAVVLTATTAAGTSGALAHGMGMSGGMGMGSNHFSGLNSHITNLSTVTTNKLTTISHDRRRFRFIRFGLLGSAGPVCVYKWTELGRVKICPADVY